MAAITKEQVVEFLGSMTVLEMSEFVKELEEKFGVSAAAPAAAAAVVGGGEAVVEKDEFDVILTSCGEKKINVIKVVRAITGLGLKEAKEVVDSAPSAVKEAVSKDEAADIQKQLEEAGASVELK